ncbi:MAG TPA: glycosyltransferase [Fimbriiglobus sp.]
MPSVSFIVPAHNEDVLLGRTLAAIHAAARSLGERYEIVVANDSSTDRTAEVARELGALVIDVAHRQIAATRNSGARASTGEYLIFVDADTVVTKRAVRAALRAMKRGVIGGGCCARFDGPVPLYGTLLIGILSMFAPAVGLAGEAFFYSTRHAFETVCGFDETLFASEEVTLATQLKRLGRFVVLREVVYTSGRKVRAHSALDMLRIGIRLARGGRMAFRRREGMDLWYGPRGE